MPSYSYKARNTMGKPINGTMDADTKEDLVDKLNKMGYMPTQVKEASHSIHVESFFEKVRGVSVEDMVMFNVQLSNLLNSGIPILDGLYALEGQIANNKLKDAVGNVARSVEGGDSFSEALARQPHIFRKLFINMARAGEASGKLDTILSRYAVFAEREADLQQQIKGAFLYPMILLGTGVIVILFVVTFVIPKFTLIFIKSGIALPLPTVILYNMGIVIKQFWYLGIIAGVGLWYGIKFYVNTKRGRLNVDKFKLKIPVFGTLERKAAVSGFARTLGTLLSSGVSIIKALEITKGVIGNTVLSRVVEDVRGSVESGDGIAEHLKISGEFPPDTIQMIAAGEESGNLDEMLSKVADFYDKSIGYTVKKLMVLIEPLFLLIMGSLVGFIMASLLLPMFDMMKMLRR